MKKRIAEIFERAKASGEGVFVAYLTFGYPSLEASEAGADELIEGGADIIEVGVPFSDPFADGPVIRSAAYRAIENGVTLDKVLESVKRLRARRPDAGLVLFTYYNLIFSRGLEAFAEAAAAAGVDAVLAVDLPFEERGELTGALAKHGLGFIPLVAPGTSLERAAQIAAGLENSFLYAITVNGITGERKSLPEDLAARLDALKGVSPLPVVAGFGISTKEQAADVCRHADGFVVGSALVKRLGEQGTLKGVSFK